MSFTPTVGQTVLYKLTSADSALQSGSLRPAKVINIPSSTLCDLAVYMDNDIDFSGPLSFNSTILYRPSVAQGTSSGNYTNTSGGGGLSLTSYAAGTVYSLTNTAAAVTFGTTSPSLALTAGAWKLSCRLNIYYAGATFASTKAVASYLYNSATSATTGLTAATSTVTAAIVTTYTGTLAVVTLPDIIYTAAAGDIIVPYSSVATAPSAGALEIIEASMFAQPISN